MRTSWHWHKWIMMPGSYTRKPVEYLRGGDGVLYRYSKSTWDEVCIVCGKRRTKVTSFGHWEVAGSG